MKHLGTLDIIDVPAKGKERGVVILFHGYGASAQDLVSLSKLSSDFRWLFPQGPINLSWIPFFDSRAWFEIDIEKLREGRSSKDWEELSNSYGSELAQASKIVDPFLDLKSSQIIFGGFSQGAMLATQLALQHKQIDKLACFSGSLVNHTNWEKMAQKRRGLSYFISHGTEDPILPYVGAERLSQFFEAHTFKGSLYSFSGGHEIPQTALEQFKNFLFQ